MEPLPLPRRIASAVDALRHGDSPVLAGYSGGADSTLALLWAVETFGAHRVAAVHFNHGLRGPESDADAVHCRTVAEAMGVRFIAESRCSTRFPEVSEAGLRRARLDFFARVARAESAGCLVVGHQADDVVESLLMRLARGSGAAGLAAPRPVSRMAGGLAVLRPLLGLRKDEVLARLRARGQVWREDASNADPDHARRNRIRLAVMPVWVAHAGPSAVAGALRARALLEEDDDALESWADRVDRDIGRPADFSRIRDLPTAVIRRVLRRRLSDAGLAESLAAPAFDALLESVGSGRPARFSIREGFLCHDGARLRVERAATIPPPRAEAVLPCPGAVFWPDGAVVSLSTGCGAEEVASGRSARLAPTEAGAYQVGPRRPGMRYRPLGGPGSAKIGDMLTNRKIPAGERDLLPVVMDAAGPVWVPGLLPAERCRDDGLRPPLRLTWTAPAAPCAPIPL